MTKEEAQTYGLIWPLTFLLSFATFDIHFLTFCFEADSDHFGRNFPQNAVTEMITP
jgi:hypothetical protein